MRILIVEDDWKLSETLSFTLSKNGHGSDIAHDGETAIDMALSGIYDLILLDIMLPKRNGMDILRTLRREKIHTPVILLSAKNDPSDIIKGLDAGADDYVIKPFHMEELMARIRAISRRNPRIAPDHLLSFADLSLDLSTYELSCNGRKVRLGLKEVGIAQMLLSAGKRIVSKEEILVKVWGYDTDAQYNNVEVYISILRKKLKEIRAGVSICTIRSVGYHLCSNIG